MDHVAIGALEFGKIDTNGASVLGMPTDKQCNEIRERPAALVRQAGQTWLLECRDPWR